MTRSSFGPAPARWRWILVAALGLLGALAYQLPAALVGRLLPADSVALSDFSGTLWAGRAGRVVTGGFDLGAVTWTVAAAPLALARLQAELALTGASVEGQGQIERRFGGEFEARHARAEMPAAWLQHIVDLPQLSLLGTLRLELDRARFDADGWLVALDGQAHWEAARVGGLAGQLGDLRVAWQTQEAGVVVGQLEDAGGPLALSGTLRFANRHYRIQAQLAPRSGSVELRQTLALLGRPAADGSVRLEINGPLVPLQL